MKHIDLNKLTNEKLMTALRHIYAHTIINLYVTENAAFGHIKPNEQIPFDKYIKDLGLQAYISLDVLQFDGYTIETGIKNMPYNEICFELYKDKIDCMFSKAPKYNSPDKDFTDDLFPYKHGLYEYLKNLYPLFRDIMTIEIAPEFFDTVPDTVDKTERHNYYTKISELITAIKSKHLRQGSCVNRYVKDLPFISPLVQRLLKKYKGRYILANSDTDSLDYKFALFSCFKFCNEYNAKLLELKILRWEELYR